MRNFGKYWLIWTLAVVTPAVAQLTTLVDAVEVSPSQIHLPTSQNGKLSFQPCSESCDAEYISVRLTPATTFRMQGKVVKFTIFRRDFYKLRHRDDGYALITYEVDKSTATSVEVVY